ncbi:hypothetical protein [Pararobbsia alpina]|uniref:Uncharacterized protein n=1 Tax=Pararobbsia alpina TaxID=621374 RepID=A0A6S7CYR0_9BURK|nr:hypothetical protein [Pararobbsia alpina]CAB3801351.1 hypothetical protein LMG28138_04993 [Pararobbsia alpina]
MAYDNVPLAIPLSAWPYDPLGLTGYVFERFELGRTTEGTALLELEDETSQRLNIVYLPVGKK